MKKMSQSLIFSLVVVLIALSLLLLTTIKSDSLGRTLATVGEDDRFYVHNSKWSDYLSGVVQLSHSGILGCTGFLIEGDVIVTAAHCLSDYHNSVLNEDRSINLKKFEKIEVFFGDAYFTSKEQFFNNRSKAYFVKDIFLGADRISCDRGAKIDDFVKDDFAFIKLTKPIPKKYKRFKMLNDINLNEYKILDQTFKKGLSVSTVGYHADNRKTRTQRLAHIGCRIRDAKKYKNVWSFYTDCDTKSGASGSPFFKTLKHKKTGDIELLVLGLLNKRIRSIDEGRYVKYKTKIHTDKRLKYSPFIPKKIYKKTEESETLSGNPKYHFSSDRAQYSEALSLNSHTLFNKILKDFKKDSSYLRDYKIPSLKKYDTLNKKFLKEKIKSLDTLELKDYLGSLQKEELLAASCDGLPVIVHLKHYSKSDFLKNEKKEILKQFFQNFYPQLFKKWKDRFNKKRKSLTYENRMKAYDVSFLKKDGSFENPDQLEFPLTSLTEDKEKSDKLWQAYFGE